MNFAGREKELGALEDYYDISRKRPFSVALYGLPDIGKAGLAAEFLRGKDALRFFLDGTKTQKALLFEFGAELKRRGISGGAGSGELRSWDDFASALFARCRGAVAVFDGAHNFRRAYPRFFLSLRQKFEENRNTPLLLIFISPNSGIEDVLQGGLEPPHEARERVMAKIRLSSLAYKNARRLLYGMGCKKEEDALELYGLFGGVPGHYAALERSGLAQKGALESALDGFACENAPISRAIYDAVRCEFGKRRGVYYTILEAVSMGRTRQNEIAEYAGIAPTSMTRYIDELVNAYGLLERAAPATEDAQTSKKTAYAITDRAFAFYFRYIQRNLGLYRGGESGEIRSIIKKDFAAYQGAQFKRTCAELLSELNSAGALPLRFSASGRWWGPTEGAFGRKTEEIDAVALNNSTRQIAFFACRWGELPQDDAKSAIADLKRKARFVNWHAQGRHEYFGILAKRISGKESLRRSGYMAFDLDDFEKMFGGQKMGRGGVL